MKKYMMAGAVAALGLAIGTAANAAVVLFNFGSSTGDLGLTKAYTVSGLTVTAKAFGTPAADLFGKSAGGDEVGLGMTNDPSGDHEIYFGKGFIQLDLSALVGKVDFSTILFAFNSTTSGERATVFGSNTAGVLGTAIGSTTSEAATVAGSPLYKYYDFESTVAASGANGGNVLLKSLTATTVPEPATWAMMLVGFGGLGAVLRRRRATAEFAAG